jgi:homoserine kinase type II
MVHEVLKSVHANGLGIVPVPQPTRSGKTWVRVDGHFWELSPWLPGLPDRDHPTRPGRLRAAFAALAHFHELSGQFHARQNTSGGASLPIPAVCERHALAAAWLQGGPSALAAAVQRSSRPPFDAIGDLAREIVQRAFPLLHELTRRLDAWRTFETPLAPAIRDLHREHVLFTGDQVTGLIDFGALRIDTPLTDVARLLGSLAGDDQAARACALAAYEARRPLTGVERELLELLDQSNVVLGGLNWLKWLYLEDRQFPSWPAVVRRLEELVARLAQIELHRRASGG